MRKRRTNWTEQKIALLVQLYPIETTPHTAQVLDMSERSVKMKARQLGLKKMEKPVGSNVQTTYATTSGTAPLPKSERISVCPENMCGELPPIWA